MAVSKEKEKAIRNLIMLRMTRGEAFVGGKDGGNYVPISQLANLTLNSGDRGDFDILVQNPPTFPEVKEVIMNMVAEGKLEQKDANSVYLPQDNAEAGDKALIEKYAQDDIKLDPKRYGKYYDE